MHTDTTVQAPHDPSANHTTSRPLDELDQAIALQAAHLDAAQYQLLCDIREFDLRRGWSGFRSCAHWLSWRIGMDRVTARQKLRVAHVLATLPRVSEAFRNGALSYSKVRAITRVATPETEEELLAMAREATAGQLERIVRGLRRAQALAQGTANPRAERYLDARFDDSGMLVLRARLPAEVGALVLQALAAMEQQAGDTPAGDSAESAANDSPASAATNSAEPTPARPAASQRRADALGRMAQQVLCSAGAKARPGDGFQVVVHVQQEALAEPQDKLAELASGEPLSAATAQRLSCDAATVQVAVRDGVVLHAGRRQRRPSQSQYRALKARDRCCCFPGCERRTDLSAHHVRHWARGGPTDASNMVMLCPLHHWAVHEGGFGLKGQAPDDLRFSTPDGRPLPRVPARPEVPDDPGAALAAAHREILPSIDPWSSCATCDGARLDLDWAVTALLPRIRRERQDASIPLIGKPRASSWQR